MRGFQLRGEVQGMIPGYEVANWRCEVNVRGQTLFARKVYSALYRPLSGHIAVPDLISRWDCAYLVNRGATITYVFTTTCVISLFLDPSI
jgi:hypothetical protein